MVSPNVLPLAHTFRVADGVRHVLTTTRWRPANAGYSKKRHGYSPIKDKCILPSQECQVKILTGIQSLTTPIGLSGRDPRPGRDLGVLRDHHDPIANIIESIINILVVGRERQDFHTVTDTHILVEDG